MKKLRDDLEVYYRELSQRSPPLPHKEVYTYTVNQNVDCWLSNKDFRLLLFVNDLVRVPLQSDGQIGLQYSQEY